MPTFTRKPGSAKSRSLKPLQSSHSAMIDAVGILAHHALATIITCAAAAGILNIYLTRMRV